MGFSSVSKISQADDSGQVWVSSFRKAVSSAATGTNGWVDYTYFPGSPPANFYASSPLTAAVVESDKGIYTGGNVTPATKHLKNLMLMSAASSATSTTNGRQQVALCDYLLYYPFIDTDAIGEEQVMDNTVTIPRYTGGQVVAIAQSASSTLGQFTFNYTNQDGVAGRVSQNNFTFVVAGGGLMCLAIVKPLIKSVVSQECRRTTSSNLESFGSCTELSSVIHQAGMPQIQDGAVIGMLASGYAGSLASSILAGTLETIWSE